MHSTTQRAHVIRANNDATARAYAREPFANRTRSLTARYVDASEPREYGAMPQRARELYDAAFTQGGCVYTVFSYATPIAWEMRGESLLVMPYVRYSQTTSAHQDIISCGWTGDVWTRPSIRVDVGDPAQVRRGRGLSPFGARVGWL